MKSSSGYEIYHNTLSSVLDEVERYVQSKGYEVGDYFPEINHVSYGTTERTQMEMLKDGRIANTLAIQIYRLDSGKYELNCYPVRKFEIGGKFAIGGKVSPSRLMIPNVRGGWTKEKIIKYFKEYGSDSAGTTTLAKYISQFDNWQDFKEHIYYHGTTNYIERKLMPSMAFSEKWAEQHGGGGYGDRYYGISLTKRKRTAESFSGQENGVSIYPVILKKDAKVIERTDLQDASDVEDIIVELFEQGIDAVWIGGGEEELVVINPYAIILYKKGFERHSVFGGFKSVALTDEKIKEIYDNSLKIYEDYESNYSKAKTKEERIEALNSVKSIQFATGGGIKSIKIGDKFHYKFDGKDYEVLGIENSKIVISPIPLGSYWNNKEISFSLMNKWIIEKTMRKI